MAKKTLAERFPLLKKAWEEYGFASGWDQVKDIKIRSDGCYAVVWFHCINDGVDTVADFYRTSNDGEWEVQNDGHDAVDAAQWKKLHIVPECDWFEIAE